jgi:hypothetical protein
MKFKPGFDRRRNLSGRPPGSRDRRNLIVDALNKVFEDGDGEVGFWEEIAALAKAGDTAAMSLIANRLIGPIKAETAPVEFTIPDGATATDLAALLIEQTSEGRLSPDSLRVLIEALAAGQRVEALTELEARISALEEKNR